MKTIVRSFLSLLRRFPLTTGMNVAGLAIAFTAFLILMMQVCYEWGFDRFHTRADCLYRLEITHGEQGAQAVLNRPLIDAFVASSAHIEQGTFINRLVPRQYVTVDHNGRRETFQELFFPVYPNYLRLFDFEMIEGDSEALFAPDRIVIPQSVARKFFGDSPAVGQSLEGEGWTAQVGGVYRDLPDNSLIDNAIYQKIPDAEGAGAWQQNNFECYIRVDNPAVVSDLITDFITHFHHEKLDWKTMSLRLVPLHDVYFENDISFDFQQQKGSYLQLRVLLCIALLVVLIAAVNFTNFSNSQVPMRLRGINTQKVLGGSVGMLRFSLMMEAVCICLIAYGAALLLVYGLSKTAFSDLAYGGLSLGKQLPLVWGTACFAVLVGVFAGSWPAWYITSFPPALVLNGNFGLSPKGKGLRNALVCLQFTASFVLVVTALFVNKQNAFMLHTPTGFDQDQIAVIKLNNKLKANVSLLRQELVALPEIEAVSVVSAIVGGTDNYTRLGRTYEGKQFQFLVVQTDPSILQVLDLKPTEGRNFLPDDEAGSGVYLFNETARNHYTLEAGGIVSLDWGDFHLREQIVGFMPDLKYNSFRSVTEPFAFYVGKDNISWGLEAMIRIRAGSDYTALNGTIEKRLKGIDPDYPLDMHLFNEIQENLYQKELRLGRQISFFSLIAVCISLVGVLGVVMFESEYRRKEIGIRRVFGSTVGQLLRLFNLTYLRIVLVGFILAVPISLYGIQRWQENFAHKVSLSGWIFVCAFLLVAALTLATVSLQNWYVANENPVKNIKSE